MNATSALLILASTAFAGPAPDDAPKSYRAYVGTYTGGKSRGIYLLEMDPKTGALTPRGLAAETSNPSFLAAHPGRRALYAVNEDAATDGKPGGAVSAFAVDPATGALRFLGRQPSRGTAPCHLVVDRAGKVVLAANYGGGSVVALPIVDGGALGEPSAFVQHEGKSVDPGRQEGPHAHGIAIDAADRFAVVADLGLDKLLVYRLDAAKGAIRPNDPPAARVAPGAGPRHVAFHPDGRHLYAINEMGSTITGFAYDPAGGTLAEIQTIGTLPEGFAGRSSTAEIRVHPSGKFLYGSNRGHDSLAIFAIDADSGKLAAVGHEPTGGKTPRSFSIDPSGAFLLAANQDSGTVVVFRVDPRTGRLRPTGASADVPAPVCIEFVPAGG